MKLSARNQIPGTITAVKPGATTTHVTIEISPTVTITASITNEGDGDYQGVGRYCRRLNVRQRFRVTAGPKRPNPEAPVGGLTQAPVAVPVPRPVPRPTST
jgi:hypothetical protein